MTIEQDPKKPLDLNATNGGGAPRYARDDMDAMLEAADNDAFEDSEEKPQGLMTLIAILLAFSVFSAALLFDFLRI